MDGKNGMWDLNEDSAKTQGNTGLKVAGGGNWNEKILKKKEKVLI